MTVEWIVRRVRGNFFLFQSVLTPFQGVEEGALCTMQGAFKQLGDVCALLPTCAPISS